MPVPEILNELVSEKNDTGNGRHLRTGIAILVVFVALWFDPRITFMANDIKLAHDQINSMNDRGTRHSSEQVIKLQDDIHENQTRLDKHDAILTALLNKIK